MNVTPCGAMPAVTGTGRKANPRPALTYVRENLFHVVDTRPGPRAAAFRTRIEPGLERRHGDRPWRASASYQSTIKERA
jgi:hypothetical protein